jgi:hypothetical protein
VKIFFVLDSFDEFYSVKLCAVDVATFTLSLRLARFSVYDPLPLARDDREDFSHLDEVSEG